MIGIKEHISEINRNNEKALVVFLTAGFPRKENFSDLVLKTFEAGADIIEIGIPFGDSLADGPVVQSSYISALQNGATVDYIFEQVTEVRKVTQKPIILMSSANLLVNYGLDRFSEKVRSAQINGLIVPDVPLEEHEAFFSESYKDVDKIILTTPTSSKDRIEKIDSLSSGFVYCVSVVGTTGAREGFSEEVLRNLERTYSIVEKNKMCIGFGISKPEDVKSFSPFCDGVIVGSAIIKSLSEDGNNFENTLKLISSLKEATKLLP